jgi:TRAP-type C4-dicarboxylate transport system permease small subunit
MLTKLLSLVYPPTKRKLHTLVTLVGILFAGFAVVATWWGLLGLSTQGKIAATIGMLTTLAAGWQRARPKLDAGIDALPIPEGTDSTAAPGTTATIVQAAPLPKDTP